MPDGPAYCIGMPDGPSGNGDTENGAAGVRVAAGRRLASPFLTPAALASRDSAGAGFFWAFLSQHSSPALPSPCDHRGRRTASLTPSYTMHPSNCHGLFERFEIDRAGRRRPSSRRLTATMPRPGSGCSSSPATA
jgi:hypothetical protein